MRPIANFTLHAILAAAIAALATASAAAGGPATIKLGRNDGRVQQLEIQSYQWGPRQTTSAEGRWIPITERPSLATGEPSAKATGENVQSAQDIVITGSRIPQPNLAKGGGLDAGMKQLEAKDRMGNTAADPALESGTLRIKVKMPWLACEEGRKYPSLELSDGSQRIVLKDVVIASCGKVGVRGWDPKKKESVTGQAEPR